MNCETRIKALCQAEDEDEGAVNPSSLKDLRALLAGIVGKPSIALGPHGDFLAQWSTPRSRFSIEFSGGGKAILIYQKKGG